MTEFFQKASYLALPCWKGETHKLRYLLTIIAVGYTWLLCVSYFFVLET